MERDLTQGGIRRGLILFSLPLIAGNLLQQLYNIVDTWVVGRFLGNVALAAVGITTFCLLRVPAVRPSMRHLRPDARLLKRIAGVSVLTGAQQSIINFGILMIKSLVNSYGVSVMAAFAAGVKIDAFAYSPAQDFGNGFATFVAQNADAGRLDRVRQGMREAAGLSLGLCAAASALVAAFARPLLCLFLDPSEDGGEPMTGNVRNKAGMSNSIRRDGAYAQTDHSY